MEDLEGYRYELKMVYEGAALAAARGWLRTHPFLFRPIFAPRQVNNVYFDTLEHDWMLDHIDGAPRRAKLRLRWYGDKWGFSFSQLELKVKEGRLGRKTITPITDAIDLARMTWPEIQRLLESRCGEPFRTLLTGTRPVLINTYQRDYFISADGDIRATLDTALRAYSQTFGLSPEIRAAQPLRDLTIIELKAAPEQHEQLAEALTAFPASCIQFSKFLNGMESVL